jgi:site-specific DNA recombinase
VRVAAYARYSSDQQRDASLEDQLRNCRGLCDRQGWPTPVEFTDAAMSGARNDRPGYKRLLDAAGDFDVILVDDLSRLSRDSIESAQAVKRLTFAGVRLIGVSDGVDTGRKGHKVDVGLRGLMSELFLTDLADKTHRGLKGRALAGSSAGGLPYGYSVAGVGGRAIDPAKAEVVRRIFAEFLQGRSARAIAAGLNVDRIPSSRGGTWCMTAIYGDTKRGIGILANPIYVGRQIWNRSTWEKHPDTGRRIRKERPRNEWVVSELPELAIVDAATWQAVQDRLGGTRQPHYGAPKAGRQPKHLLSGILRCGTCGGAMVVLDRYKYGCSIHKDRGDAACDSRLRVPRADTEAALLTGIKAQLLSEDAFQAFQRAAAAHLKRAAPDLDALKKQLASSERERDNVMAAIRAGIITPTTKADMVRAEGAVTAAQAELQRMRAFQPAQMLPRARETWRSLASTLENCARDVPKARDTLRELLGDRIVVKEKAGDLFAEIAGSTDAQINVVAGAGFGLYLSEPLEIPIRRSRES